MSDIKKSIDLVYRINNYRFFAFDDFYESYTFNIFIILCFVALSIYLLIKIELKVYRKNWNELKCHPKYLYISGFIQQEGNLGPINSTFYNYNKCIEKGVTNTINIMDAESQYHTKTQINQIDEKNKTIIQNYNKHKRNIDELKDKIDVEDLLDKLDLTIDSNSASYYSQLKNIGVYIDQIDANFAYFYEYVRNYLTYLYYHFKKIEATSSGADQEANAIKASNVLKVLNTHFEGIKI